MSDTNQDLFLERIGYRFSDKSLFINAMTHSSYANDNNLPYIKNNERLEFLGDAVLELVSSRFLFLENPTMVEGKMTTLRASLVCEPTLANVAREIGLDEQLILGRGEEKTGGRGRDSVLSDALEALIGAIYLDGGLDEAERFITTFLLTDIENRQLYHDSKSKLQELVQDTFHEASAIVYEITDESGPAHQKRFTVSCRIQGKLVSEGSGGTKKKAEQEAAYQAILKLKNNSLLDLLN